MSINKDTEPRVAILLCTYNGEKYLTEQLDSFEAQSYKNWELWASDDGSIDGTLGILQKYQKKWGEQRMRILAGPRAGSTANFLSLLYNRAISSEYYAFSDQDDIWCSSKLERAVGWLNSVPASTPALYCSRTLLIDEKNEEIGMSELFTRPPSLHNALVQNIAGGNTMVFNQCLRKLLGSSVPPVVIHDWWLYLAATACNGIVNYDPSPSLRYRQHQNNLIGMNIGWKARGKRIYQLLRGVYRTQTDVNLAALSSIGFSISAEKKSIIWDFQNARNLPFLGRAFAFKRLGLYRQTTLGNIGLIAGFLCKKI